MSAKKLDTDGNLIVLVVDRLGSGYLGPYGNTWLETPAANRLAAEGITIEYAATESPDLLQVYSSYWSGLHLLQRRGTSSGLTTWLDQLPVARLSTCLLTDDERVAYHPLADHFRQREFHPQEDVQQLSQLPEETGMMRSFARWMARLETMEPPFMTWIHASGMNGAWDAPYEYRLHIVDPDDPPPPSSAVKPNADLRGDASLDPDHLWGLTCAYAAQVMLFDECLEMFLQFVQTQPWGDNTSFLLTSPRGYPLGEHGIVGDAAETLLSELVHVPVFLRQPLVAGQRAGSLLRVPALLQPSRIGRWIADGGPWRPNECESEVLGCGSLNRRDDATTAVVIGTNQVSLRTRHWCYVAPYPLSDDHGGQLFVKPDDRWEFNDVAERAPEEMQEAHLQVERILVDPSCADL
ncbi:MAG: hypothetical protein O2931_01810 [Planctomycetota bacterium]|nr:hypothetical protein [Planctomycetota bacterium]MDA1177509.1 hypothetical protein [Planctomycetota bacterium]